MDKQVKKILKKIGDAGFIAYAVGGYPRDLILKRKTIDIDICTNATPKDLKEIFSNIEVPNMKYGSVSLVYKKTRFEITTFRKEDGYENYRKPSNIEYIDDLYSDLIRRDFTINTLCLDRSDRLIDLLNAKEDLDNKLVRMIGNPKTRLKEDVLRILRAIRFATILNFNLDNDLKKYIKEYGYLLRKLSYERKKAELDKIFMSNNAGYGIELIKKLELDHHLELKNIDKLQITSNVIGMWAQLGVIGIYKFNRNECNDIMQINELLKLELDNCNIYKYGLYISSIVAEIKGVERKNIVEVYNKLPIKNRLEIKVSNKEIINIIGEDYKKLKKINMDLENKIINKEIVNNNNKIKDYVRSNYI